MAEVILRKLVFLAVEHEPALVDAVGIPSYGGAEIGLVVFRIICLNAVETENHVGHTAVLVGNHQRHQASAEVGDARFGSGSILEHIECGRVTTIHICEICRVEI